MANYTWGQGSQGNAQQAKPGAIANMGTGDALSQGGFEEGVNNATANGYGGPFYRPQNYADAYGQNMGKAMNVLQGGFFGQQQGTTDFQNQLQQAASQRLAGFADNQAQNKAAMSADLEKGFQNNLDMLRRGAAGTGAAGSIGYGRSIGGLSNQFQQNQAQGLLNLQNQGTQELGQLGDINNQIYGQQYQTGLQGYNQAHDLSNLYTNLADKEAGRESQEAATQAADTAARKAAQAQIGQLVGYHVSGQSGMDAMKSMGGATGGAAMMSDRKLKKNISEPDNDLDDFMDGVSAAKYYYKDDQHGSGKQYSPMAQDLEKHPVGKAMVVETDKGKAVDYGKGLGVMMALHAHVHKRLKKLEGKKA